MSLIFQACDSSCCQLQRRDNDDDSLLIVQLLLSKCIYLSLVVPVAHII